jgi:hypothetical protein
MPHDHEPVPESEQDGQPAYYELTTSKDAHVDEAGCQGYGQQYEEERVPIPCPPDPGVGAPGRAAGTTGRTRWYPARSGSMFLNDFITDILLPPQSCGGDEDRGYRDTDQHDERFGIPFAGNPELLYQFDHVRER